MRRLFLALLLLLAPALSHASWTGGATGSNNASASSTTIATSATVAMSSGDFVAIQVKWESADTTVSCSNATDTSTDAFAGAHYSNGGSEPFGTIAYLTSTVTASRTVTCTFGASRPWREIAVKVFTPSGTPSADGTPSGNGGTSTSAPTGNITTTGTDGMALYAYSCYGQPLGSPTINSTSVDGSITTGTDCNSFHWLAYSSGFTGQGNGTHTSESWSAGIAAFNISAGGAPPPPTLMLIGVGP